MANRIFDSDKEFRKFLKEKKLEELGEGSEAKVYLSNADGLVYKPLSFAKKNDVITMEDISVSSFAFPIDLFLIKNSIVGYTSEYIYPDLFAKEEPVTRLRLAKLNLVKLQKALEVFKKDTDILTKEHIEIDDLFSNLIFTGDRLVAIDTLSYRRRVDSVKENNDDSVRYAIQELFNYWLQFLNMERIENKNLDDYFAELENVQRRLRKDYTNFY